MESKKKMLVIILAVVILGISPLGRSVMAMADGLYPNQSNKANQETLYMVNNNGEAIIPMAGIKLDLIYDGIANTANTTYTLSNDINNYKMILVYVGVTDSAGVPKAYTNTQFYVVNEENIFNNVSMGACNGPYSQLVFTIGGNSLTINIKNLHLWRDTYIYKIYGIY